LRLVVHVAAIVLGCASGFGARAAPYTFTDLGAPGGEGSIAFGINNGGVVVGNVLRAYNPYGIPYVFATKWVGGTAFGLDAGGANSGALGVNDAGQIVGYVDRHATVWTGSTPTDLGTLGGIYSVGWSINGAGQVAGDSYIAGGTAGGPSHATVWNDGAPSDLGTLGGENSSAVAINASGQLAGNSRIAGDRSVHATFWNGVSSVDLGTLAGGDQGSYARGMNDAGQVVGNSYTYVAGNQVFHAFLWDGTKMLDLSGSDGLWESVASDINNTGQVVGSRLGPSDPSSYHATLWDGGTVTDLNIYLDTSDVSAGWVLRDAVGINDSGWIAGTAYNKLTGQQHAYLMSLPDEAFSAPEPTSGMLVVGSLALLVSIRLARLAPVLSSRSGGQDA
jgi:probable HAF family extracellular repeat protein